MKQKSPRLPFSTHCSDITNPNR